MDRERTPNKPRRITPAVLLDTGKYLLVMAGIIWLLAAGSTRLGYNWQWYRIPAFILKPSATGYTTGPLLQGLGITLEITAISMVLMLVLGLGTALMRMSRSIVAIGVARVYMELIRNTPLLIQLFFLYFVAGPILGLSGFWAAVIALSMFEGAYASEIFRAGITSIDRGQWEAARSLGMPPSVMYRKIILPQAIRRVLPPITSQAVSLVKDSALVSTVAILDLTQRGRMIDAETFLTFEIWFTVAAIYLVVTLSLSSVARILEKRLGGISSPTA
ncbi:amino acid ABC transporter permease [Pseudodesulfovibrio sp.]|uniref:amino acid ABC transporter permease n=1 Tax=unclassified Pseudodesulfovibrio TaxID=2661612 RepID=UPI003B004DF0